MTFFLSFLFLVIRIVYLLCFPDVYGEDLILGALPKELLEGLRLPFLDYAAVHYHGGTLVYGLCTVPLFLLFGKSVFALRLTALLFQYGAFLTWYLFMKRFFGKRPALYTALLYLCSPPWLTLFSMFANGSHTESLLFTALGLLLLYKILYEKTHQQRDSILLGLVCGFGTYFTYGILVSTLSFILFWVYEDRSLFKKREFRLFCLFFVIGFSPWIVYNLLYRFHGTDVIREGFAYPFQKILIIPFRFLKLATLKVASMLSFNYREGMNHYHPHTTFLNVLYYIAILSSYVVLYRFERHDKKAHFLFLFPLLYLSVMAISQFYIQSYFSRYLVPLFPFFFAVIGLGLTHVESLSRSFQKVSFLILILLLTMGVKGELNLLLPKNFGLPLKYQGYSYRQLGLALVGRYVDDPGQVPDLAKRIEAGLSPSERFVFYHGLSVTTRHLEKPEDIQKYLSWLRGFDKRYRPFFVTDMGSYLCPTDTPLSEKVASVGKLLDAEDQPYLIEGMVGFCLSGITWDRLLNDTLRQMQNFSPQNQMAMAYALGKLCSRGSFESSFLEKLKRRHQLEPLFLKELLPLYYRGVGALMAEGYDPFAGRWPVSFTRALGKMETKTQELIYWGAGFETPLLYEDPYEYERMNQGIPPEFRETFKKGLQDRLSWGGRNYWIETRAVIK